MRALRPALPVTILIIIGGWMAAGVIITMSVALGWPPVASAAIELPGWDWLAGGVGTLLFLGGWLVLMSGRRWHRLNMRWACGAPPSAARSRVFVIKPKWWSAAA